MSLQVVDLDEPITSLDFSRATEYAKNFHQNLRKSACYAILCGLELIRLRDELGETRGGDQTKPKQKPRNAAFTRWSDLVRTQVGISEDTARRWMNAAIRHLPAIQRNAGVNFEPQQIPQLPQPKVEKICDAVAQITEGRTLAQLAFPVDDDAPGFFEREALSPKDSQRYEQLSQAAEAGDEDAAAALDRVHAGEITPGRAWAGLQGKRGAGGKGGKAATNHLGNLRAAFAKLRTTLPHWHDLKPETHPEFIRQWREIVRLMPDALVLEVAKQRLK